MQVSTCLPAESCTTVSTPHSQTSASLSLPPLQSVDLSDALSDWGTTRCFDYGGHASVCWSAVSCDGSFLARAGSECILYNYLLNQSVLFSVKDFCQEDHLYYLMMYIVTMLDGIPTYDCLIRLFLQIFITLVTSVNICYFYTAFLPIYQHHWPLWSSAMFSSTRRAPRRADISANPQQRLYEITIKSVGPWFSDVSPLNMSDCFP